MNAWTDFTKTARYDPERSLFFRPEMVIFLYGSRRTGEVAPALEVPWKVGA